jgi:hypothetical protein
LNNFNIIYKLIFYSMIFYYMIFIRTSNLISTYVDIKLLVYLDKVYAINKLKWNHFLNKVWFNN